MLNPGRQIPAGYSGKFHDPNVGTMGNFRGLNGFGFEKPALRISGSYDNYRKSTGIEFGAPTQFEDDSGISSPPLWKMSPPGNPTTKAFRLQQQQQQQHLTTSSRSQAIADGRRELMEMIQGVPEAAYELSLKDLVELPTNRGTRKVALQGETDLTEEVIYEEKKTTTTMTKTNRSNRHVLKHGNAHRGAFLLNMFFPISLGSKKRSSGASTCSKVSPKPLVGEAEKSFFEKGVDREWWNKQNSAGGDSESSGRSKSSGGSMSSSSSSGRQMSGVAPGCWFFFHTNNSKTKGHKR